MRLRILLLTALFIALPVYIVSCDSSGNEAEELSVNEDSSNASNIPEIKQEVEQPIAEIKEETIPTVKPPQARYLIQIGAFRLKTNADDFLERVKTQLNYELECRFIGVMYKIQTGEFESLEIALKELSKISEAGFSDAFIIKVKEK